jgi:hypothetical protein
VSKKTIRFPIKGQVKRKNTSPKRCGEKGGRLESHFTFYEEAFFLDEGLLMGGPILFFITALRVYKS